LTSEPSAKPDLRVTKRYRLDAAERAVEVTYSVVNQSNEPRLVAPREIQRTEASGALTFYPSTPSTIAWISQPQSAVHRAQGWLAHVSGSRLLLKTFVEADVEVVTDYDPSSKRPRYVQVALQAPSALVAPGAQATWQRRWLLRQLPADILPKAGNQALLGFVQGVIQ
jgi:hypothetical protein